MTEDQSKMINRLPERLTISGNYLTRVVRIEGEILKPGPSQEVYNHSPDGFAWGYSGSGPAQLALAILMTCMSQEDALRFYQEFKQKVVALWPHRTFVIDLNLQQMITNIVELQYETN